jgi:voltage-gated potassium channel
MNRRIVRLIFGVVAVYFVGVVGYMLIEGWSLLDAFYMTTITISTVGFGEIIPLTSAGRAFTILLILAGVGIIAYSASVLGTYLFEAGFAGSFRRRRMERQLRELTNHVIVVGYGRVGRHAAEMLEAEARYPVIVLDIDEEAVRQAREAGFLTLQVDATTDEALQRVGIERAKGLLVSTGSDTTNLFVVLSARELNRQLRIVARASEQSNENKMHRAGANHVVLPHNIGGARMASSMIRPKVTEVMDVVSADTGVQFLIEEIQLRDDSPLIGKSVGDARMRQRSGITLISIVRVGGQVVLDIDATTTMQTGDQLIVMGTRTSMREFEKLVG